MSKALRRIFASEAGISVVYRLIRGYSSTFKLTIENEHLWMDHVRSGGSVVLCCWHQQFFSAIRHFRTYSSYRPPLMISKSKDGEIIAGIAIRTGWDIIRGSSSKGGNDALKEMVAKLKERRVAAHILDGPRGPAGKVKAGIIRLAQLGGAAIAPFYASAESAWYFNSWDHFLLPKPFAKVHLRFGELFTLQDISTTEDFERERLRLEETMLPGIIP